MVYECYLPFSLESWLPAEMLYWYHPHSIPPEKFYIIRTSLYIVCILKIQGLRPFMYNSITLSQGHIRYTMMFMVYTIYISVHCINIHYTLLYIHGWLLYIQCFPLYTMFIYLYTMFIALYTWFMALYTMFSSEKRICKIMYNLGIRTHDLMQTARPR